MSMQPVLLDGVWRESTDLVGTLRATDPTEKVTLPDEFPVSGVGDVELAAQAAYAAQAELQQKSPADLAAFLENFAEQIEARADELVALGYRETGLAESPRLREIELPRTTNQIRQAAAAARAHSWVNATIDTASGIRSMFGPLDGAVVVFGPNNFPFAFNSVAGGDFVAAIAAGNPVIGKANTGHPGTTKIFAEAALAAIEATAMPRALVQLIYRTPPDVGLKLVSHPLVAATGFTGSRSAGLKLKEAADKAGKLIYLEMSSINPVFVLPGAIKERGSDIAGEFTTSCTLGAGQFCTNPGVVVLLANNDSEAFISEVAERMHMTPPGVLLSAKGPDYLKEAIEILTANGATVVTGGNEVTEGGFRFENTVLRVKAEQFIENPEAMQTEAFGATSLFVFADTVAQMTQVAAHLEGNLTGGIYSASDGSDDEMYTAIEPTLRTKVGRLLNDKMPTGVAVVPSMNHGGPYPATSHPGFTAVGIPAAMTRFAALYSYDNVRPHRLPAELRDKNPTGSMWRLIDGTWTQGDISA